MNQFKNNKIYFIKIKKMNRPDTIPIRKKVDALITRSYMEIKYGDPVTIQAPPSKMNLSYGSTEEYLRPNNENLYPLIGKREVHEINSQNERIKILNQISYINHKMSESFN